MWFHRHVWPIWSELKSEEWERQYVTMGVKFGEPNIFVKQYQDRYCTTCGKYAKRYV